MGATETHALRAFNSRHTYQFEICNARLHKRRRLDRASSCDLNELPLSTIKIDQSFIRGITSNSNAAAIITTILGMSRSLGFKVIAEGVEKEKRI